MHNKLILLAFFITAPAHAINCGPDGEHPNINIGQLQIQYSGNAIQSNFGYLLKLGVTPKNVQTATQQTQQLNQYIQLLAAGYNSCAITKAQYSTATERILPSIQSSNALLSSINNKSNEGNTSNADAQRLLKNYLTNLQQLASMADILKQINKMEGQLAQIAVNTAPSKSTFKTVTFEFKQSPFDIYCIENHLFYYGFSSLEQNSLIKGKRVKVVDVKAVLDIVNGSPFTCCDVWVFVGSSAFGFPESGGSSHDGFPGWLAPRNPNTTQAQMVINGVNGPQSKNQEYWTYYNFQTFQQEGYPELSAMKVSKNPEMSLPEGLFAQLLLWTGDPRDKVHIDRLSLIVKIEILGD